MVTRTDVERFNEVFVMKCGTLNYRAAQLYRFEVGYRRHNTGSTDLVGDLFEQRQLFLCRELIRDCPTRCLGSKTEFFLLG